MSSCTNPDDSSWPPSAFVASDYAHDGKKHLLLAASGSVATIKIPNIVHALSHYRNLSIRLVFTKSASRFLAGQSVEQPRLELLYNVTNVDGIYHDEDEWKTPWVRGASILHIELRRWADMMVVAPLSANSLAKMSVGLADNLLLSVARAWDTSGDIDGKKKRILVAAAMNTAMWRHPVTAKQIALLKEDWGVDGGEGGWVEVLEPVEKVLACGDNGDGAMREWTDIVHMIEVRLDIKAGHERAGTG